MQRRVGVGGDINMNGTIYSNQLITAGATCRKKSANGTTGTPIEDPAMMYYTALSTANAGIFFKNTLSSDFSVWMTFKTITASNVPTLAMTIDANQIVTVAGTTAFTSSTTGALVCNGGVGIAGDVNTNGTIYSNQLTTSGPMYRKKSANGITGTPIEDPGMMYYASSAAVNCGLYFKNSLTSDSSTWLEFKTVTANNAATIALTIDAFQNANCTGNLMASTLGKGIQIKTGSNARAGTLH